MKIPGLLITGAFLLGGLSLAAQENPHMAHPEVIHRGGAKVGNGGAKVGNGNLKSYRNNRMNWIEYPNDAHRILNDALRKALMANNRNNIQKAREELVLGLTKLSVDDISIGKDHSLILDAAQTGNKLNQKFFFECDSEDRICQEDEDRLAAIFMSSYLEFMQRKLVTIDRDYYLPHYRQCNSYKIGVWRSFIVDYSKYVSGLMDLYLGEGNNPTLPWSTGSDWIELNIMKVIMEAVVHNLSRDVFNRYLRYEIRDAILLLDEINTAIESGYDIYQIQHFVIYARREIRSIRDNLKSLHNYNQTPANWSPYCHQRNE